MSFEILKTLVTARMDALVATGAALLTVQRGRAQIWDTYFNAFPDDDKQEHNCNCCKSFLRKIGHVVVVHPETLAVETLWDLEVVPEHYAPSIAALAAYVRSCPIDGMFYYDEGPEVGTDQNFSEKHQVIFKHFHVKVPKAYQGYMATKSGDLRTTAQMFKRALLELTPKSLDTVLELIAQKSLYRGTEKEGIVKGFKDLQEQWTATPSALQENFIWHCASTQPIGFTRVKNDVIGQLLGDLSEGKPLNDAVASFQKMVDPTNYQRTTAPVTTFSVNQAKEKLTELGMISALARRRLDTRDLGPHNALFVHRALTAEKDIFAAIVAPETVKVEEFTKCEEISIDTFLDKVLPTAKGLRVLVENRHLPCFVTLTGAVDTEAPNLFKWESSFGWSYAGGVASSMRERVRRAGGRVDGVLRFTHSWNWDDTRPNTSLMDLHVFMPGNTHHDDSKKDATYGTGRRVGWNRRTDPSSGGIQDVDYTAMAPAGYSPVENITFPNLASMPQGNYIFKVHNWQLRKPTQSGFQAEIEFGGQVHKYQHDKPLANHEWVTVAEAVLKDGVFTIKHHLAPRSPNETRWGVTTNQWRKVKAITLSPNHWERAIGLKHYFFMLEGCVSDETTRGFYNEFLCEKLQPHRKVTELLADKAEVLAAEGQELSGLGFSGDERNHLMIEVEGSFKRVLRVTF